MTICRRSSLYDRVVLLVLQLGAVAFDREVTDVKIDWNIVSQRVVTKQYDTATIEGVTVPRRLAFSENYYAAIGCGRNDATAGRGGFYRFNANVALEEERHETLQHVVTVVRSAFRENAMTVSSAGDLLGSSYMWAVSRLRCIPRGTPQAGKASGARAEAVMLKRNPDRSVAAARDWRTLPGLPATGVEVMAAIECLA